MENNSKASYQFPKSDRILKPKDFQCFKDEGKSCGRAFGLKLIRKKGEGRLGLAVSRRFGKAYLRNYCKRVTREVFRNFQLGSGAYDYLLIGHGLKGRPFLKKEDVRLQLEKVFEPIKRDVYHG